VSFSFFCWIHLTLCLWVNRFLENQWHSSRLLTRASGSILNGILARNYFLLVEYKFLKDWCKQLLDSQNLCLLLMPLVLRLVGYSMVALTGKNKFALNIALFAVAIFLGKLWATRFWRPKPCWSENTLLDLYHRSSKAWLLLPSHTILQRFFFFEHMDLLNTGQYGILDSYQDLQVFRKIGVILVVWETYADNSL